MDLEDYNYCLPDRLIAQSPSRTRSSSRLLVCSKSSIKHTVFNYIPDFLHKGDVLVINESKVIPAKLIGKKDSGGKVEVILTRKIGLLYEAVVTRRVHLGSTLLFDGGLSAKVMEKNGTIAKLQFHPKLTASILRKVGQMPIPPYVKKPLKHQSRYQTVYCRKPGSIAAHTAGLHFTQELLQELRAKGVKIAKVCLHISYSTFFPIRTTVERHKMHPEYCSIDKTNADVINNRKGRLIAVGTTVVKTLESLADSHGMIHPGFKDSDLFIYPPYDFKVKFDGVITNFHLPKSTLLLLVSAFFGRERILNIYAEAIKKKYRFYSFGDAMLLLKE
ncbi:MAG: tRNA preQ1(34) S-adenosylmethionine ribosyltransferase-isomerase QueA [Candidatus Woesearchaeota archaeon]